MVYPAGARTGDNCLLGTKVMVPIDGPMRENIGLLGSPAFEIPRETVNDQRFNPIPSTPEEEARLTAKNHFNFRTALLHLGSQWTLLAGLALIGYLCSALFGSLGWWCVGVAAALAPLYGLVHGIIVERWSTVGIRFEPHNCTIHQPHFWWIERHWKLGETLLKHAMPGTPFRPMILRLLGLKVGAKLFEDGSVIPEKPLVEIGDNVCINAGCSIQGHSLEDGLFKSDRITIGNGCTIGPAGFVHYGVTMAENTVLGADAFLMKGATTTPGSVWQGNPARPV